MEEEISEMLKKLLKELEELKKYVMHNNKKIVKTYSSIKKQYDKRDKNNLLKKEAEPKLDKKYERSVQLNDYTKIVLNDFESRISILEEENQKYKNI